MTDSLSPRAQKLRDAGHKLTNARLAVLQALEDSGGHITSAEVLSRVDAIDPATGGASLGTEWRTNRMVYGCIGWYGYWHGYAFQSCWCG